MREFFIYKQRPLSGIEIIKKYFSVHPDFDFNNEFRNRGGIFSDYINSIFKIESLSKNEIKVFFDNKNMRKGTFVCSGVTKINEEKGRKRRRNYAVKVNKPFFFWQKGLMLRICNDNVNVTIHCDSIFPDSYNEFADIEDLKNELRSNPNDQDSIASQIIRNLIRYQFGLKRNEKIKNVDFSFDIVQSYISRNFDSNFLLNSKFLNITRSIFDIYVGVGYISENNYINSYLNNEIKEKEGLYQSKEKRKEPKPISQSVPLRKESDIFVNNITDEETNNSDPLTNCLEILRTPKRIKEVLPQSQPEIVGTIANILFVKYNPLKNIQQDIPTEYPVVKFPKNNCIVRSHRYGNTKRRGFKELSFQHKLENYFSKDFKICGDVRINTGKNTRPYEPDIALIDINSGLNIRIDIEIDEPYAGTSRQATHCIGEDDYRDLYFIERGWIVIRFSEYQVHIYEKECLAFISNVISSINSDFIIPFELNTTEHLLIEKRWDIIQAQRWEKEKYREYYLNHEFGEIPENEETVNRELSNQENEEEKQVMSSNIGVKEKVKSISFNKLNQHPRDKRIKFYPENHVYTINGITAPSASTIISKFFPEFDTDYWSKIKAPKLGMSPEKVREMWKEKGENAANQGTYLHQQIENFYLNIPYTETEEFYQFIDFTNVHSALQPYRTEWRIFDDKYQIAGTIDFIVKNGIRYELYDWKRSKKVVDLQGEPIIYNSWQQGIGSLSHIDDTSYNRYCLQQSLYKYILENNYNLKIDKMFLVVLHPNNNRYYKVEVPYYGNEVKYILEAL